MLPRKQMAQCSSQSRSCDGKPTFFSTSSRTGEAQRMEATTRFTPHPAGESDGSSKFVQKRRGSMASYGAISEAPVAARRPGRALVLAAATMALSAAALLTAMTVKGATAATGLEEIFVVPGQQLRLGEADAKVLPVERHWETDGWPTQVRCPGPWCEKEPYRNPQYPNNKAAFTGDKDFPLAWGPCNIAIQDC